MVETSDQIAKAVRNLIEDFFLGLIWMIVHYMGTLNVREDTVITLLAGLGLGLVVLVFLVLFPGRKAAPPKKAKARQHQTASTKKGAKARKDKAPKSEKQATTEAGEDKPTEETSEDSLVAGDGDSAESPKQQPDPFNDPRIIKSTQRAAKLLGLTEEQCRQAIADARVEYETGVPPDREEAVSWASLINYAFFGGLVAALIYTINKDYGDAVTKWFVISFPREAEALGIAFPISTST